MAEPIGQDQPTDVLIVDDDAAIRKLVCVATARVGVQCDMARDGGDALQKMTERTYAVVLLDLMMPGVDGAEFLRRLAAWRLSSTKQPIILLMTAFSDDRLPVVTDTIHAIVRKPFDIHQLVELVRGCVNQRRTQLGIAVERER